MPSRREFLGSVAVAGGVAALASMDHIARGQPKQEGQGAPPATTAPAAAPMSGPHLLPPLPYGYDALEPHIDKQTMMLHHDKHHQAYVDKLNKALEGRADLAKLSIEELLRDLEKAPPEIRTEINNQGGGHANHSVFWSNLAPPGKGGGGEPGGELAAAIKDAFGGLDKLKDAMTKAALARFGSGWSWLLRGKDGKLAVESFANQDSPLAKGARPLLGLDVWEHAYYLKYQNRRNEYVAAFWNVVNWKDVEARFAAR